MAQKKGIDVSVHNGYVSWNKMKSLINFAMIRGGFSLTFDTRATDNIEGCLRNGIPFGIYWFSYASTPEEATKEAEKAIALLKNAKAPIVPVAFDFEYDSDNYLKKCGVTVTNELRASLYRAFAKVIENHLCRPLIYTNMDYLGKGFASVANKSNLWLAHWGVNTPGRECVMWQSMHDKTFPDVVGRFDYNTLYDESIFNACSAMPNDKKDRIVSAILEQYEPVARDVIAGKYGNGAARKLNLAECGYDYVIVQAIVNELLS